MQNSHDYPNLGNFSKLQVRKYQSKFPARRVLAKPIILYLVTDEQRRQMHHYSNTVNSKLLSLNTVCVWVLKSSSLALKILSTYVCGFKSINGNQVLCTCICNL